MSVNRKTNSSGNKKNANFTNRFQMIDDDFSESVNIQINDKSNNKKIIVVDHNHNNKNNNINNNINDEEWKQVIKKKSTITKKENFNMFLPNDNNNSKYYDQQNKNNNNDSDYNNDNNKKIKNGNKKINTSIYKDIKNVQVIKKNNDNDNDLIVNEIIENIKKNNFDDKYRVKNNDIINNDINNDNINNSNDVNNVNNINSNDDNNNIDKINENVDNIPVINMDINNEILDEIIDEQPKKIYSDSERGNLIKFKNSWKIFVHLADKNSDWSVESFDHEFFIIDSVGTFLNFFNNFYKFDCKKFSFFIMKNYNDSYIDPIWEHPKNRNGGICSIRIDSLYGVELMQQFCFLMMNECLIQNMDIINGISYSVKTNWADRKSVV